MINGSHFHYILREILWLSRIIVYRVKHVFMNFHQLGVKMTGHLDDVDFYESTFMLVIITTVCQKRISKIVSVKLSPESAGQFNK